MNDELTEVAAAVIERAGEFLLAQRPEGKPYPGYWEFPGGKIEPGEEPEAAARRELAEETGLTGGHWEPLLVAVHDYPDRHVRLHAFVVRDLPGEPRGSGGRTWVWRTLEAIAALPVPEANLPILRALGWRLP